MASNLFKTSQHQFRTCLTKQKTEPVDGRSCFIQTSWSSTPRRGFFVAKAQFFTIYNELGHVELVH